MEFKLSDSVNILERTPGVLQALLGDLPARWVHASEGEKTWSPYDIVGHLNHGERTDWMPRLQIILTHGTSRAFDPFDRFAQLEGPRDRPLIELLTEFSDLRHENLVQLAALQLGPQQLTAEGRHPDFGVVTASQLLATWAVHDLNHLAQLSRVLAVQHSAAVGPWKAYLGVLNWK